jgi:hypothetical protein
MSSPIVAFVADVEPDRRPRLDRAIGALRDKMRVTADRPFGDVETLHFASITVFDTPGYASTLVFENNFDGSFDAHLKALLETAAGDLLPIFECCVGFDQTTAEASAASRSEDDTERCRAALAAYLRRQLVRPNAYHVGNFGRDRGRIQHERELRTAIDDAVDQRMREEPRITDVSKAHHFIDDCVRGNPEFEWLKTPARSTALERLAAWLRLVFVFAVLAGIVITAVAIAVRLCAGARSGWERVMCVSGVSAIVALILGVPAAALLRRERRDRPLDPRELDPEHDSILAAGEDRQLQNHLASITIVKEGRFRRSILRVVLWTTNLFARISTHGTLSGISSIHFAHWSLLDGGRRLLFLSNYDGAWSSYLDEFVDHAARGLTAIWSNTVGFPRTRLLLFRGARDRAAFKAFARMQQAPTGLFYSAYPNLSVQQIDSNTALRDGLVERLGADARSAWLRRFGGGNH